MNTEGHDNTADEISASQPASLFGRLRSKIMPDISRLSKTGVFHVFILLFGVRGITFIQQILLVRLLSKEEIGEIVFAMRIVMLLGVVADMGMSTAVLKYCSEPVSDEQKRRLFRTAMLATLVSSLVISVVYCIGVLATDAMGGGKAMIAPMLFISFYLLFMALRHPPEWYLQARKQIKKASMMSLIVQFSSLVFIICGVLAVGQWGYFIGVVMAAGLGLGVFLFATRGGLKGVKGGWAIFRKLFKLGSFSLLANFSGMANTTASVLLLKWLSDDMSLVATYGIASYIIVTVRLLPESLRRTSIPYLGALIDNPSRLGSRLHELVRKQFMVMGPVVLLLAAVGYWIIPFVFGQQYQASYLPMIILLGGLMSWSLVFPYGLLLILSERVEVNFALSLIQLALNISMCLYLIPRFGPVGAAGAMAISQAMLVIPKYAFGKQTLRILTVKVQAQESISSD